MCLYTCGLLGGRLLIDNYNYCKTSIIDAVCVRACVCVCACVCGYMLVCVHASLRM